MSGTILQSEIYEQPQIFHTLIEKESENIQRIAQAIRERNPRYVLWVARGSSDNAARYGQYLFATINGLVSSLALPSAYTVYGQTPDMRDALVISISQSGQSPDIIKVVEVAKEQGAFTLAVTNNPDSPLAKASEYTIPLHAGVEQSIAATKSYTASLLALAMLSAALAQDEEKLAQIKRVPQWVEAVTEHGEDVIAAANRYAYIQYAVVLSRGFNYATAFETALKLKELTYIIAEPYSSADFKHGPVALIERSFPLYAVIPEGLVSDELVEFIAQLAERGAELIVVSAVDEALAHAQTPLRIPSGIPEWLSPLVAVVPGQLFALGLTIAKRFDPDQPRGLRKVTLTV